MQMVSPQEVVLKPNASISQSLHWQTRYGPLKAFGIQTTDAVREGMLLDMPDYWPEVESRPYDIPASGAAYAEPRVDVILAERGESLIPTYPTDPRDGSVHTGFMLTDAGIIVVAELQREKFVGPNLREILVPELAGSVGGLVAAQGAFYLDRPDERARYSRFASAGFFGASALQGVGVALEVVSRGPSAATLKGISAVLFAAAGMRFVKNSSLFEDIRGDSQAHDMGREVARQIRMTYERRTVEQS